MASVMLPFAPFGLRAMSMPVRSLTTRRSASAAGRSSAVSAVINVCFWEITKGAAASCTKLFGIGMNGGTFEAARIGAAANVSSKPAMSRREKRRRVMFLVLD